jgi:antitoxin CptB
LTEPIDIRRKRLRFRSWHRGTREADLVLGRFADRYLPGFDTAQLDAYERLLEQEDPDLWDWLIGATAPPPAHDTDVLRLLQGFRCSEGGP